jgi:uncharacterized protein YjiS (DUF1127 family)
MSTMKRQMPMAARMGAIANFFSEMMPKAGAALRRNPHHDKSLHDLSDWILYDIGLEREDVMSPEARRIMNRLNVRTYW